jgi:hypothetical protein
LTIRAADGYSPLLVYRPSGSGAWADQSMLQLIGGNVRFVGIHFYLDVTEPLASGCWLVDLRQVKSVKFENCTVTIRNDHDATVSFVHIEGAPSRMVSDGMPPTLTRLPPAIEMNSCIVRGPANLVRAVEGLPFRLNWLQGFLATSKPAIYAKGVRDMEGPQNLDVSLERVTASIHDRLCLVELDGNTQTAPNLLIEAERCVFDMHGENTTLVEHRGVDTVDALRLSYVQQGGSNLYSDGLKILWRIATKGGEERVFQWGYLRPGDDWYQERRSEKNTLWRGSLPASNTPIHSYSFHDFLLVREQAAAGFDELLLPTPPELRLPMVSDTPESD